MDGQRFDDLNKALAARISRRRALKAIVGTAAGGLLARPGRARVHATALVGLCHRTQSAMTPFVYIEVDEHAVADHEAHGDLVACPGGQVIDPATCTCVCPPPKLPNPDTGACECPPVCCPPELGFAGRDPVTCACQCAAGFPVACGTVCCPAGETCATAASGAVQCSGETAAGRGDCGGGCVGCEAFCADPPAGSGYAPGSTCCAREVDFTCCPPGSICSPFGDCCCPPGASCGGLRACAC